MEKTTYAEMFSKSLNVVTGESGIYKCPLCLTPFPVADADTLTWDHYPPRSIGGRDCNTVLVCQDCQKRWNHVDAELVRLKAHDEFDRTYPGAQPKVLSIPDEPYVRGLRHRVAIDPREGKIVIMGRSEHNAEGATLRLTQFLNQAVTKDTCDGLKMTVQSDPDLIYRGGVVERSFLKAAYLAAFDGLGYPYVLSPALSSLRQQMLEPETAHLQRLVVKLPPRLRDANHEVLMAYLHTPKLLESLAVFFFGYCLAYDHLAFLPLPTRPIFPPDLQPGQILSEERCIGFVAFQGDQESIADSDFVLLDENGKEWPLYRSRQGEV